MPVNESDLANLHTMPEAAEILHVSHSTVKRLVREHRLETVRIGTGRGRIFITQRALLAYANSNVNPAAVAR
jgi:excisionase family DNA binding protein